MSGIEICGLILAAYPLILETVQVCKRVRSGELLAELFEDVRAERVIFRNWVEYFCVSKVPDADLLGLFDHTSPEFLRWKDKSFLANLVATLDQERTAFLLGTLKHIHDELSHMQADLARMNPSSTDMMMRMRQAIYAMRYSQDNSALKRRITTIRKLNERLSRLAQPIEYRAFMRKPVRSAPSIQVASCAEHATNLHHAIQKHYNCSCSTPHLTKFRIPQLATHKLSVPPRKPAFQLLFSVDDDATSDIVSPTGTVKLSDSAFVSGSAETLVRPKSSEKNSGMTDRDGGLLALSSIASNSSLASAATKVGNTRSYSIAVVESSNDNGKNISDLCETIRELELNTDPNLKTIGSLRYQQRFIYELRTPKVLGGNDSQNIMSLDELFSGEQRKLNRRYRVSLALHLSWAVLQLCSTPWIDPSWSWGDFSAIQSPDRSQEDVGLFVTKSFYSTKAVDAGGLPHGRAVSTMMKIALGEPPLARLGCALIELAFGKRLASLRDRAKSTNDSDIEDLITARRLLDDGYLIDEESQAYSDVVWACLHQQIPRTGGIGMKKLARDSASFQKDATEAIIQPLYHLYTKEWGNVLPAPSVC